METNVFEPISRHLYQLACEAYLRCLQSEAQKAEMEIQPDAVTSVILSVAALEGFINELTEYSRWQNPEWGKWGSILDEAEQIHSPIKLKYLLTAYGLGKSFDKGAPPYQDFELLIDLRNALVHPKQETRLKDNTFKTSKRMQKVLERVLGGAIYNTRFQHHQPGYNEICSTPIAKWACNTASKMIHAILERLPDGGTKEVFEVMFCRWPDGRDCFQTLE